MRERVLAKLLQNLSNLGWVIHNASSQNSLDLQRLSMVAIYSGTRIQMARKICRNQSFFFERDSKIIPDHCKKAFPSTWELRISERFEGVRATDLAQTFNTFARGLRPVR